MSTPRRVTTKTSAKRKAAARKRTRELAKRLGALAVVAILVLGTVYAGVIANISVNTAASDTPVATAALSSPTQPGLEALLTRGDEAAAAGQWISATNYYQAYLSLGQNQENADVHFKLGKAILNSPNPNYVQGLAQLQQALSISQNGSFAQEANSLLQKYNAQGQTAVAQTQIAVTSTLGLTSVVTGTHLATPALTGTVAPSRTVLPAPGTSKATPSSPSNSPTP